MKKVQIETNFYGWILWNFALLISNHSDVVEKETDGVSSSNMYIKSGEVDDVSSPTVLKTNRLNSSVSKVSFLQVALMKYLFPLIFIYMFIYINTYYPSMVGLCFASLTYIFYWQLVRRFGFMYGNFLIVSIIVSYWYYIVSDFDGAIHFNLSSILNYAVQYFIYIFILESVFVDIFTSRHKNLYSIKDVAGGFFSILNEEKVNLIEKSKKRARIIFTAFLGLLAAFSFVLGGTDLWYEIDTRNAVKAKALKKFQSEQKIIDLENYEVLKQRLDSESKSVGINYHSGKASLDLMKKDLDKYKKHGVVGYDKVRITRTTKIMRLEDKNIIPLTKMKVNYFIKPAYVKMYESKYRWHFMLNDKVHLVMNATAR